MLKIFDRFFTDESAGWEPSRKIPLHLNLQTESLNGVRLGDSLEKLRVFGRPDNRQPFRKARFEYYLLGFDVEHENGRIINFAFIFDPPPSQVLNYFGNAPYKDGPPKYADCELILTAADSGRLLNVRRGTTLNHVEQVLGVAPDKDIDGSYYRQGRLSLSFFRQEDNTIEQIIVEE